MNLFMETLLTDITGTLGQWIDNGFDNDVPDEAVNALYDAYRICCRALESEED